ncbi:DUF6612 family protein [Halobacterium litoreum]|uniref:DUF6612 family protein n=1 Tax=Halobacterium litoreum TaxID=2039234 RepID=A0ABD5NC92_9EURY|nr:DUF6612 family protein [Halobacterium litoreum]UHH14225.1 hypothetical protein LT972_04295 [Halobacterium litoreum]
MQRRALSALCVAALLVTAGCAGLGGSGDDGADGQSRAAQIATDSGEAMQDVETYQMDVEMEVSANGQTLTMTQRGVYNRTAERARIDMTVRGTEAVSYMDGTTMYVKTNGMWQTRDVADQEPWESGSGLARQQEMLGTGEVSVTGSATVDGVATTVLTLEPDPEELKQFLAGQGSSGSLDDASIDDVTYELYVANETDRPRKVEMEMEMTIQGQSATADATIAFSNYGEPVTVEIPEDAPTASVSPVRPTAAA